MEFKTPERKACEKKETRNIEQRRTIAERRCKGAKEPTQREKIRKFSNLESRKYHYEIDQQKRVRHVSGVLRLDKSNERNPRAQLLAGGKDRRIDDHGGHYIARVFGASPDKLNLFAQNGRFNQGEYKKLENEWKSHLSQKKADGTDKYKVNVDIRASYKKESERPHTVFVYYKVQNLDDKSITKKVYMFRNERDPNAKERKL